MAQVTIDDLSGTSSTQTSNPYDGLIDLCKNDPKLIQARYSTHRTTRNTQQKAKILAPDFSGWILDPVLTKLDGPQHDSTFTDPRHCLVFWARPPKHIIALIDTIQHKLRDVAPGLWLMPLPNLHMTAMEVTHSLTAPEIDALVDTLRPACEAIANMPSREDKRVRLVKPMVSFDAAALALSFIPAQHDAFTYHHLRRDLHAAITEAGVPVASRYVVPSAHLTIARFNTPNPFGVDNTLEAETGHDVGLRKRLMDRVDTINAWLEEDYWPESGELAASEAARQSKLGGEMIVGEEKGLDFRKGTLWYGGGETIYLGKGIGQW